MVGVESDRLRDGTAEGQHRQASVLQLLDLHLLDALLRLGQESLSEADVTGGLERQLLEAQAQLLKADGLDGPAEDEQPPHRALAKTRADKFAVRVDDVEVGLLEDIGGETDGVRSDQANAGQHRDAPVLQLRLAEVGHQLRVLGEAHGVELVPAPGALGAHKALRELAVVDEADAGVLIGDCEVPARSLLDRPRIGSARPAAAQPRAHSDRRGTGRGCQTEGLC
mmetsp:Transcript_71123/g.161559  ORF Transcript_71123/g.161559 Transcript_71123/m.161559 type:complete len:225 (-) Transcript_71123:231-905(-)